MTRFERIVHQFRHFQVRRPVFVVGADPDPVGVKSRHHALFQESSRANLLPHRRLRRIVCRRVGGAFRRIPSHRRVVFNRHILALDSPRSLLNLLVRRVQPRIGCPACQKSTLALRCPLRRPVTIAYPFASPRQRPARSPRHLLSLFFQGFMSLTPKLLLHCPSPLPFLSIQHCGSSP